MPAQKLSVIELLKHLPKNNCKECGQASCMAFATLAIGGSVKFAACPYLDSEIVGTFSTELQNQKTFLETQQDSLQIVREKLQKVDFSVIAPKIGARYIEDMLLVECLGRNFMLDTEGNLHSECHNNVWVQVPLISYVLNCKGVDFTGKWVKFDELDGVMSWTNFFRRRCEDTFHQVVDEDPELFFDILDLFGAEKIENQFSADYSVIIRPLPKIPFLACYWKAEDEFESTFSLFFDKSINYNIDVDSIYALGRGIIEMIKKIIVRHNGLQI